MKRRREEKGSECIRFESASCNNNKIGLTSVKKMKTERQTKGEKQEVEDKGRVKGTREK